MYNDKSFLEGIIDSCSTAAAQIGAFVQKFFPVSHGELYIKEFSPIAWCVSGLIPAEATTAIAGEPCAFKTWLLLDFALAIAKGEKFLNIFETNQMNVLFIDEDNGERLLNQRLKLLSAEGNLPIYYLSYSGFRLNKEDVNALLPFCAEKNIGIVFIDAFRNVHDADENSSTQMKPVLELFKQINQAGIAIVFNHHSSKPPLLGKATTHSKMRGTSSFRAVVECEIDIDLISPDSNTIIITQSKNRSAELVTPFKVEAVFGEDKFHFDYLGEAEERKVKKSKIKDLIRFVLTENPMSQGDTINAVRKNSEDEVATRTFYEAKKEMLTKEELFEKKAGKKKILSLKRHSFGELFDTKNTSQNNE
ncbi:MAG: AAA family ATPase [Candidatus Portnoybacteria bacterium]|nr:AAA family ATPase [Candidatus Portnoybacteria bacterium]